MRVAAVQFAPVFLDTEATLHRMLADLQAAAERGAHVVAFPETALSGYPTWLARTDGARFDDARQKAAYAAYLDAAVEEGGPELAQLASAARDLGVYLLAGVIERGRTAGRGTTWASLFRVGPRQAPVLHRKLVPTYEERLVWGAGDASGLVVHEHGGWRIGALNCWENWMPLARASLYELGEDLHVSAWPGSPGLTRDIARFVAREGRVFSLAASGVLRAVDIPSSFPLRDELVTSEDLVFHSGGSRIVAPDGRELAALDRAETGILIADLDPAIVRQERQNFDPTGHYSRPELLRLEVDRRRYRGPEPEP
jgi:nitrilase